jgi:putative MATE family efflux protein
MSQAKFTTDSLFKHIITMSLSATIGVFLIFVVDAIDIFYMSKLGLAEVAGVGLASQLLNFTIALGVGVSVTMGVKVSYALGAKDYSAAAKSKNHIYLYTIFINLIFLLLTYPFIPHALKFLGANGAALEHGVTYLKIVLPSTLLLSLSMSGTALLRAYGKPALAVISPIMFAIINIGCAPILIFVCDLGVAGGAFADVIARTASAIVTFYLCHKYCNLNAKFKWDDFIQSIKPISAIALPAILTALANPLSGAIAMREITKFGHSAIVGFSIISRIIPVAFTILISAHNSIGPIFSQNYGAKLYARIKETLIKSAIFVTIMVLAAACILNIFSPQINHLFAVDPISTELITFFCKYLAIWYLGMGLLFIALTGFNSLGKAKYSTLLNFTRATLGTIPFVVIGGKLGGPAGLLIGQTIGNTLFGIMAFAWCYLYINALPRTRHKTEEKALQHP